MSNFNFSPVTPALRLNKDSTRFPVSATAKLSDRFRRFSRESLFSFTPRTMDREFSHGRGLHHFSATAGILRFHRECHVGFLFSHEMHRFSSAATQPRWPGLETFLKLPVTADIPFHFERPANCPEKTVFRVASGKCVIQQRAPID